MSRGPNYHPSHTARQRRPLPARTEDAIRARNRAWRELQQLLPLPARYLDLTGSICKP